MSETCFTHQNIDPYVRVKKSIAHDRTISWKAKGILMYAFSRINWQFWMSDLINQATDGRDSLQSGLKELEKAGYLHRIRLRDSKTGRFGNLQWHFFEDPINDEEFKKFLLKGGFPVAGFPTRRVSHPKENQVAYVSKNERNKDIRNKESSSSKEMEEEPKTAAASFSDEEMKALRSVDLDEKQINDLLKYNFSKEEIFSACRHAGYSKNKKAVGWFVQCIRDKWYLEKKPTPSHRIEEENKEAIKSIAHLDGSVFKHIEDKNTEVRVTVDEDRVIFITRAGRKEFNVKEKDFKQKVYEYSTHLAL